MFDVQSFYVRSFYVRSFSTFSHSTFSHSTFGLSTCGHSTFGHPTFGHGFVYVQYVCSHLRERFSLFPAICTVHLGTMPGSCQSTFLLVQLWNLEIASAAVLTEKQLYRYFLHGAKKGKGKSRILGHGPRRHDRSTW
jgi:hypothetical protein